MNSGQMGANSTTSTAHPDQRNRVGVNHAQHSLFLVEINGFHESLQHDDPRLEDTQTEQQRRQPGPLGRVRQQNVVNENHHDADQEIAVHTREQRIDDVQHPAVPGNIFHFGRQAKNMFASPA